MNYKIPLPENPGETLLYSTDEEGELVAKIVLKNDGTIEASNDNSLLSIDLDGNIGASNDNGSVSLDDTGNIDLVNASGAYGLDDAGKHTFNGGSIEAARNGDKVTVTIPANTFVVEVTGGSGAPAVGVKNPLPIDVDGTIKEGTNEVLFP
jgi:hypothetical protein